MNLKFFYFVLGLVLAVVPVWSFSVQASPATPAPPTTQSAPAKATPAAAPAKPAAAKTAAAPKHDAPKQASGKAQKNSPSVPAAPTKKTAVKITDKNAGQKIKKSGSAGSAKAATAARPSHGKKTAKSKAPASAVAAEEHHPAVVGGRPNVLSHAALVLDTDGQVIYSKNADLVLPIASITKLMTAVLVLEAQQPLDEMLEITDDDCDHLRNTHSRLRVGTVLDRRTMLRLALMSSENRAAAALGRSYPGGRNTFIRAMNMKALALGMHSSHFADPTGLDSNNVSTAQDLVKLVKAAAGFQLIRDATTTSEAEIQPKQYATALTYRNTNRLVRGGHWDIRLSKTGYLNDAGRCLVMQAHIDNRALVMVLLNGAGKQTPMGDADRIRAWLQSRDAKAHALLGKTPDRS